MGRSITDHLNVPTPPPLDHSEAPRDQALVNDDQGRGFAFGS